MADRDYDAMRSRRDFDMNPPSNAPGQGGSGWDDLPLGSSGADFGGGFNGDLGFDGGTSNSDVNSMLNGQQAVNAFGIPINPNTMPQNNMQPGMQNGMGFGVQDMSGGQWGQPQQDTRTTGEKISDGAEKALFAFLKGAWNFTKVFVTSFKNNTSADWYRFGKVDLIISLVVFGFAMVMWILSVFLPNIHNILPVAIMSVVMGVFGVNLMAFCKKPNDGESPVTPATTSAEENFADSEDNDFTFTDDDESEDMDDSDWSNISFTDDDDSSFSLNSEFSADDDNFNVENAVNSLGDMPAGMYTRQYLIETFSRVLPHINPDFAKMTQLSEGDDEFLNYEQYIKDAAYQTGVQGDKLDELQLLSAEYNSMILKLTVTRPTGIKEQEIANGFADCYKRDDSGAVILERESVYAVVDLQVGKFVIILFLCNNVMVSIADLYSVERKFIENPKVVMPLFWGINEYGRVFCYDGIKAGNGSMLISGEGRSGKSWKGQSLIAQMTMFMSPAELELYFFDKKDKVSDYYYLSTQLPHVRGFCGDPLKFVSEIKKIIDREYDKRQKMLLNAGVNNINDYNKLNPDNKMSYIYIVVDEMASAMAEMDSYDKDLHSQFDSLMVQVVTQLPYFGIRLMLFPHRIVNTIINKTVAQQISCRAVVGVLDFETLKAAVDIKNTKEFPYSLVKPGDMAIRSKDIRNGAATYTHSEVIGDSEAVNRRVFDYIGKVWSRLEPDYKPVVSVGRNAVSGKDSGASKPTRDTSFSGVGDYAGAKSAGVKQFEDASPVDEIDWDAEMGSSKDDDDFWKNFGS